MNKYVIQTAEVRTSTCDCMKLQFVLAKQTVVAATKDKFLHCSEKVFTRSGFY